MNSKINWDILPILHVENFEDGGRLVIFNADGVYRINKVESERNVFCYDADGKIRWRVEEREPVERGSSFHAYEKESADNGRLFDDSGSSYKVNLATGHLEFIDWAK